MEVEEEEVTEVMDIMDMTTTTVVFLAEIARSTSVMINLGSWDRLSLHL